MRKKSGKFILCKTDVSHIEAHARRLAKAASKQYSGSIEAWFDPDTGNVTYTEHVGLGHCTSDNMSMVACVFFDQEE